MTWWKNMNKSGLHSPVCKFLSTPIREQCLSHTCMASLRARKVHQMVCHGPTDVGSDEGLSFWQSSNKPKISA